MRKWIILTITLLALPIVLGYSEVQYSSDNITCYHRDYTNNNTITLEILDDGIDADTSYYFRVRHIYDNWTSNWTYTSRKTESGGIDTTEWNYYYLYLIAFIIFLVLLGVGYKKEDNWFIMFAGMLSCMIAFALFRYGFPDFSTLMLNWLAIVFAGVGFYLIILGGIKEFGAD